MANISITSVCNQECGYCFARLALGRQGKADTHMSRYTFGRVLDFLERSGIKQARLLGGEPTLHPDFPLLSQQALSRGFSLLVFSNGLMPEHALRWLEAAPPDRVSVLVNVTDLNEKQRRSNRRKLTTLCRLGARVIPGVNIQAPAVKLDFLFELVEQCQLSPKIRLGLAHPCVQGSNVFLHKKYYPEVGRRVAAFALAALEKGVRLEFDCGFVPCMFPYGSHARLGKVALDCGLRCNPILDVLPGGQVVWCYPLADIHHELITDSCDAAWLRARFQAKLKPYRSVTLYQECVKCELYKSGGCLGGCLATSMQRLRRVQFKLQVPENAIRLESTMS